MASKLKVLVLPLLAVLGVGCAPQLRVNVLQPAPVNLGAARKLSVVQTEGRRSAREVVVEELLKQSRGANFFTAQDRSEEGITVKVMGRSVQVAGGTGPGQSPDEVGLRIDVLNWNASPETRIKTRTVQDKVVEKDKNGKDVTKYVDRKIEEQYSVLAAKVVLGVTAFNHRQQTYLAEREFEGRFDGDREEPALKAAAAQAVAHLLREITPSYVMKTIRMDDEDERQKPIIKIAEQGNVAFAIEEMEKYVKENPTRGSAQYNLAVLLDAQGRYTEALDLYNQALRSASKDYYFDAKSECARRLADQQALQQQ
jgi:hypothetical protein